MSSAEEKLYEFSDAVKREGADARDRASEGISKIKSRMSSKSYGPPNVPKTPSPTVNNMLETRCNKTFDNPAKYAVAFYVCFVFTGIVKIYNLIHKSPDQPVKTMWMAACGVASLAIVLAVLIAYNVIVGLSFIIHNLLYFAAVLLALSGIGLGVSGIVFYNKDRKD